MNTSIEANSPRETRENIACNLRGAKIEMLICQRDRRESLIGKLNKPAGKGKLFSKGL